MSLAPGTRLGAYEIVALIGAGGMGEVYRAREGRSYDVAPDGARFIMVKTGAGDDRSSAAPARE